MTRRMTRSIAAFVLLAAAAGTAQGTLIDFEAQAAERGGVFTGNVDSPLTIGLATFTGGELLNNETSSVDLTGVYATYNLFFPNAPYQDPITISFSAAVSNFSVEITNNLSDVYTVSDNLGGSSTLSLGGNDQQTFTLADTGITSVTILATTVSSFDFAIDNVSFTPAPSVPEPSSLVLCGIAATIGVGLARARRNRAIA